jgi:hypothetical protein
MQQQPVDIHTRSYRLWRQALSGDSDGALLELETIAWEDLSVLAADLLARLYVRTGRLAEARMLWEAILRIDPTYSPATRAMNKLNSLWLVRTVIRKYSAWFCMGLLLLLASYGAAALFLGNREPSFALVGTATVLAVLGIYLAGFFGWAYLAANSLFAVDRSIHRPPTQPAPIRASHPIGADTPVQPQRR